MTFEIGNAAAKAAAEDMGYDPVARDYPVATNAHVDVIGDPATSVDGTATTAAGEGFVVSYELGSNTATSWYNHAGLLIRTDAATEAYQRQSIVVQMRSDGTLMIGFGYVGTGNASPQMDYSYVSSVIVRTEDGGKTPMRVTVVYYNEAYYVQVEQQNAEGVYAVVHAEKWDETRGNYSRGKGLYSSELTRKLGVNGFYAETVYNFTYEIGNAAAQTASEAIAAQIA